MEIELAKSYGFCFGVKRAIKIAESAGAGATIGELIHNRLEIERLEKNFGVRTLSNLSELTDEKKAIIRTHGITKSDLATLQMMPLEVIDATCPFVKKPREIVEKVSSEGYEIVFFGDATHPEVKGIVSFSKSKVYVVSEVSELLNVKFGNKVALLSQTTKKVEKFCEIAAFLVGVVKELRVFNTICNATLNNQKATSELAKKADVMVIIGGKNSSNTKQLYLIAKEICEASFVVESAGELRDEWFVGKWLCGVGAGASTPEWVVSEVVAKIRELAG